MINKLRYEYLNKRVTTRYNVNIKYHDHTESKIKSTINANCGTHTLTRDKMIKSQFNENNVSTIKSKGNSNNDFISRACAIGTMVPI